MERLLNNGFQLLDMFVQWCGRRSGLSHTDRGQRCLQIPGADTDRENAELQLGDLRMSVAMGAQLQYVNEGIKQELRDEELFRPKVLGFTPGHFLVLAREERS